MVVDGAASQWAPVAAVVLHGSLLRFNTLYNFH